MCRICLSNVLSVVRVNICFQSTGTGKYATLVTRHLNFQHTPLVISYNLIGVYIILHRTQLQYTLVLFWQILHGLILEKKLL